MSTWYRSNKEVTHYCGGREEKERNNKPKGTQTELTYWFNPVTEDEGILQCRACGSKIKDTEETIIEMGE